MHKLKRRILAGAAAVAMFGMQFSSLPPGTFPEGFTAQELTAQAIEANPTTVAEYEDYLTNQGFQFSRAASTGEDTTTISYQITGYSGISQQPVIPGERSVKKTADSTDRVTCKVVWIAYGAFAGNQFITKVTIPPQVEELFATSFKGCTALESVEFTDKQFLVPNTKDIIERFNSTRTMTPTVKLIGSEAFKGCTALTSINLPDSMTTLEKNAFQDCGLKGTVTIPPAVQKWGYGIFSGCTGITGFAGPTDEENPKLFVEDGMILVPWGDGGRGVMQAPAGAEYNNVPEDATVILPDAFSGCDSESATIGENVSEIYERAFYHAFIGTVTFSGCAKKLQYNAITETRFNNFIIKCDTLTEAEGYSPTSYSTFGTVTFTPEVTQIAPMFFGYDRGSGYTAEDDLEAMSTVTVLRFNADKVDGVLNGTFAGVQKVLIGSNVAKIPYGLCAAHRENATRLSYVEIPNGVKIIDNMAFFRCSKLNALKLPDSLEEIRYAAFASSGLTSVYVPGNVTTLGPEAFADMKALEWIAVPNNFRQYRTKDSASDAPQIFRQIVQ